MASQIESSLWSKLVERMHSATPETFIVRFNEESDELFVNLTRDKIRDVSVYIVPDFSVRASPDRSDVYGLVIENFVSTVAPKFPELLSLLDWSELPDHEVMSIRRLVNREASPSLIGERLMEDVSRLVSAGD